MKKIAVVILNWNGVKLLEQFLPSVIEHSSEATIYVADNASTDISISFVQNNYPSVIIIQNSGNLGYAGGYNQALQQVEEPYYALVNSDIEVSPNWLLPLLESFEQNPQIAVLQPKILDYKNKQKFEYAGAAGGFLDALGYPYCRGRIFQDLETDKGQYNDITPVFWASGACFFIRKDIFRALQGFDEHFFAHQEEIDLCWRVHNLGYTVWYNGKSTVYHVGGATLSNQHPKKTFLNFRNSLLVLVKNLPAKRIIPTVLARLCLDGIAGIYFLFQLKPLHTWAIVKAHFSFYSLIPKYLKKRGTKQIEPNFKPLSIVWNYYVKGIKTV